MSLPNKSQSELLDEELVAYLDGQLDSASARLVEHRLANEEPVRRRLQELARSWDLLDQLPGAVMDDTFTRSTVEMVAHVAEEELAEQRATEPRQRRMRWLWGGLAAVAAGLLGFFIVTSLWSDPNDKLLRDLPVIANLEVFRQAGDIDFVRKLNDESLFSDEASDAASPRDEGRTAKDAADADAVPESLDERRAYLGKLTPPETEDLRSKFDKFEALPAEEQERLRRFESQLQVEPQEERLRRIMQRFHEWLKTLLPTERADLLSSDAADRIARIKKSRHEQEARLAAQGGGPKFLPRDVDALKNSWMEDFATVHEAELLKALPPERQKEIKALDPANRRKALVFQARLHWRNGSIEKTVTVTDVDMQKLAAQLSPGPRGELESQPTMQQRIKTVSDWLQAMTKVRWFRQGGEGGPAISADDLEKFFQSLPAADRDRLMGLPRDEMNRELRRLFLQQKRGGRPNGPRDSGGSRDSMGPRDRGRDEPKPDAPPVKPEAPPGKDAAPPANAKAKT